MQFSTLHLRVYKLNELYTYQLRVSSRQASLAFKTTSAVFILNNKDSECSYITDLAL